ncbi:MAG: phosphoesterase [Planctomycetaceae bacterium]|nr:phosphoesterase [Planctomycetaceae bacterium]
MSAEEQILVVPTALFHEIGCFQGFSDRVEDYLPILLADTNTEYRPRSLMEQDPSFKQLIPYVVFRVRMANGQYHYFHYTRGSGQGEKRLHAKKSVGVGGHISLEDTQHPDAYAAGMLRELNEEIEFGAVRHAEVKQTDSASIGSVGEIVGLINDDSNEVGRVHLGVVHVVELIEPRVAAREKDLLEAKFSSPSELMAMMDQFETWSQIALRYLLASEDSEALLTESGNST